VIGLINPATRQTAQAVAGIQMKREKDIKAMERLMIEGVEIFLR
jgi:hypothetical protein